MHAFMSDFEPSDQLTTPLEPYSTQAYQIRVESQPTIIKTVVAVTSENPAPVNVKVFKKGVDLPIKDYKGRVEVLDIVEIIEDQDIGTYIIEFMNPGSRTSLITFIIKQIQLPHDTVTKDGEERHVSNESLKKSSVSKEEARLYDYLDMAHHGIKHLEVEQGIQQSHMTQFLYGKSTSPLNDYELVNFSYVLLRPSKGKRRQLLHDHCRDCGDIGICSLQRILHQAHTRQQADDLIEVS